MAEAVERLVVARDAVAAALHGGADGIEFHEREMEEANARDELRVILAMHGVNSAHAARMEGAL